jgi:hypothetical protein
MGNRMTPPRGPGGPMGPMGPHGGYLPMRGPPPGGPMPPMGAMGPRPPPPWGPPGGPGMSPYPHSSPVYGGGGGGGPPPGGPGTPIMPSPGPGPDSTGDPLFMMKSVPNNLGVSLLSLSLSVMKRLLNVVVVFSEENEKIVNSCNIQLSSLYIFYLA